MISTPSCLKSAWLRATSSMGLPMPPRETMTTLAKEDSYEVASKVHDLIVKTRPDDAEKITLIRDLIARHVDVNKILKAL